MSPSPRRHTGGLSPRQRRLLQASARMSNSKKSPQQDSRNEAIDNTTTLEQSSPPSFPSTPVSKRYEPHNYLNVSLSPIYDFDNDTPVMKGNKYNSRQFSGASDQTTPTQNISRGVRKLRLNDHIDNDEISQKRASNLSNDALDDSGGEFVIRSGLTENRSDGQQQQRWKHNKQRLNDTSSTSRNSITQTRQNIDENGKYYRIVFKGVVSLLTELDDSDNQNNDDKRNQRSGAHVSYGEIVTTSCPEITIPFDNDNCSDSPTVLRAIQVDSIVTGGYATDASPEMASTKNRSSTSLGLNRVTEDGHGHLGYLLLQNKSGQVIAEPCARATTPSCEYGSFSYRVNASSPVTVLSGPSLDAPPLRCALLPGTIHEMSLRMIISTTSGGHGDDNTASNHGDTLGEDGDTEVIQFLRLGRRKGWVADRVIGTSDGSSNKLHASFVMVDVTHEKGLNQTMGSQSVSLSMSFEETSSMTSFAMNSTANSSFYSSLQSSSVATPATVKAQRKRNIRRRAREADVSRPTNIGDSFEDVESSITGGGGTTVISGGTTVISGDGSESSLNKTETCYLCRVIAPQGLKILDAPHFQVSSLIHSPTPTKMPPRSSTSTGFSPFSRTNAMVTESSPNLTGGRKKSTPVVRYLMRGQFFEASQRMESTGKSSLYSKGQGLLKLADGSGWAIIPYEDELVAQFKSFHGSEPDINDLNAARGFEEVGNAIIPAVSKNLHRLTPTKKEATKSSKDVIWFRVVAPNGVKVLLAPKEKKPISKDVSSNNRTPQKNTDHSLKIERSTSSLESEVASVASNTSFFGSVWSRVSVTPSKQSPPIQAEPKTTPTKQSKISVIPCGTAISVESWDNNEAPQSFVRLVSGGWIPRSLGGMTYSVETGTPDIRTGSFWFRVKCSSGIDARHGPSLNAPSISSESGSSFRFECGEYLRASEIITFFDKQRDRSFPAKECFAKLYRKNRIANESNLSNNTYSLLSHLGEWVQVFGNGQLILEECANAPSIERDRNGWRCTAVSTVQVRLGPSFQAGGTAISIRNGLEFFVVEKVACPGEQITWMRLKSGEGWVPSTSENGEELVHCYLQRNEANSQRMVRQILHNNSRTIY